MQWLDKIATGQFETEMVSLCMTNGYGERFEGQGFMKWTRDVGVQIDALTNGSEAILKSLSRVPCAPGQLIPHEYYLRLQGQTHNGETVVIERILPHDRSINTSHPTVAWKIFQRSVLSTVTITERARANPQPSRTELLLNPVFLSWPKPSNTTYENPHFGMESSDYDWLEFTFSGNRVAAKRLKDNLALVRVDHSPRSDPQLSRAIRLAFGFVTGRAIAIEAEETHGEESVSKTIFNSVGKGAKKHFSSPLPDVPCSRTNCELLLSKAAEFFFTDTGRKAGNLLRMCHTSLDSTFTTQALVACVVLESLVKLLTPKCPSNGSISSEQKNTILKCVRSIGLDEQVANRFSGFIDAMDAISPKNHLRAWATRRVLGIEIADVNAWDRLRNRAAHGSLLMDGDSKIDAQEHLNALNRVENIVNKLLLNAMQYEGKYYDHADRQVKQLTCAPLTMS